MDWLKNQEWSPYTGGIIVGLLSWFSFLTVKQLGASTSFVKTAGMIEKLFFPEHVEKLPYFISKVPEIDWQWMLLFGILLGSYVSAKLSGRFQLSFIPPMWEQGFGTSRLKRWVVAFLGGVIGMFGARLAGG